MACVANVQKGRELVLLARNDNDTAWEIVGGIKDLSYEGDAPTEEVTSSSTTGDFQEFEATGYKNFTMQASGVSDERTGVEPVTGLNIVGSQRLSDIFFSEGSCNKFQIQDTNKGGTITGVFVINFGRAGSRPGLLGWTASFQASAGVVKVGDI